MSSQPYLRVNGVQIDSIKIRPKMVAGAPIGEKELVIEDPVVGSFAVDDRFILEITYDRRRKWEPVTPREFLDLIDSSTATK